MSHLKFTNVAEMPPCICISQNRELHYQVFPLQLWTMLFKKHSRFGAMRPNSIFLVFWDAADIMIFFGSQGNNDAKIVFFFPASDLFVQIA